VKYAIGDEIKVMNMLSEKYMSDEETDEEDDQFFIRCTLSWRSSKLNKLILKLDKRYKKKKDDSRPVKPRKDGEPSARAFPKNPIPWAIRAESISEAAGSEHTEHQVDTPIQHLEATEDTVPDHVAAVSEPSFDADYFSSDESDEDSDGDMDSWLKGATGLD